MDTVWYGCFLCDYNNNINNEIPLCHNWDHGQKKEVYQYSLDGIFLHHYSSIKKKLKK